MLVDLNDYTPHITDDHPGDLVLRINSHNPSTEPALKSFPEGTTIHPFSTSRMVAQNLATADMTIHTGLYRIPLNGGFYLAVGRDPEGFAYPQILSSLILGEDFGHRKGAVLEILTHQDVHEGRPFDSISDVDDDENDYDVALSTMWDVLTQQEGEMPPGCLVRFPTN